MFLRPWAAHASASSAIVDEGVFALCEDVCGSLERQLAALNELMDAVGS